MANSIIDQQRDNRDFRVVRSVYNGQTFMINWLTGEHPPEFYIMPDGKVGGIEDLMEELNQMMTPDNRQIANS